jgi:hypothetical protein
MSTVANKGFEEETINQYRSRMESDGKHYILDNTDENTDEYAHFYFVGKYEGKDTIYNTVMYTLRMQHESELFEIAEHRAANHFPNYRRITYEEDENGNLSLLDDEEEEIGLFIAEVIMELENEESVKVSEHVEVDDHVDFGIALDVGLHIEEITPEVIERFIHDFTNDELKLDKALYSFQTKGEEA